MASIKTFNITSEYPLSTLELYRKIVKLHNGASISNFKKWRSISNSLFCYELSYEVN